MATKAPHVPQDATEPIPASTACTICRKPRTTQERACFGSVCEDCFASWQQHCGGSNRPQRYARPGTRGVGGGWGHAQ